MIPATTGLKRFVGSACHELAGIEHDDLVGLTQGAQRCGAARPRITDRAA